MVSKRKNILFFCLLSMVFIIFFKTDYGYAEEENTAGVTGFTYNIIYPENQIDKELGYYKLKMVPDQKQELTLVLSNPSTESVTIEVKLNGAKTNQNGVIEYGESTIKNDPSLKYNFTDIVKGPESVVLEPGETKNLELTVKMPENSYDGVIAGGIQLMRADQNDAVTNDQGSKVINQYAYIIGMVLQETDVEVLPDLALNSVKVGQSNYRNSVFINFSNTMPSYLNDMVIEVKITKKGGETVLYERKQMGMRMAPNSFIDFPVSMNGEKMVAGSYNADIEVTSNEKKWSWKQEFEISDEDANEFNHKDIELIQNKGIDWKLIVLLVIGLLIVLFFLYFFRKKNEKKN